MDEVSPMAARVEAKVREIALTGGDIFQATSAILAIVGAAGRRMVVEAADHLHRLLNTDPDDATLRRSAFLLDEILKLRVWIDG